jgi:hypothetical protein
MDKIFYGGNSLRFFREVSECDDWVNSNMHELKKYGLARGFKLPKATKLDVMSNIELDKLDIHSQELSRNERKKISTLLGKQSKEEISIKLLQVSFEEVEDVDQYTGELTLKKQLFAYTDIPYELQEERNLIIDSLPWKQGTLLDGDYPGIILGTFRSRTSNSRIEEAAEFLDAIKPEQIVLDGLKIKLRGEY